MSKARNGSGRFICCGAVVAALLLLALTGCQDKPVAESIGPIHAPPRSDQVGDDHSDHIDHSVVAHPGEEQPARPHDDHTPTAKPDDPPTRTAHPEGGEHPASDAHAHGEAVAHGPLARLELKQGDHICLVGNALGERMQHHNYWETLLYQRYPDLDLTVRNLCFPADEPLERLRSLNFGSPDDHLKHSQASVVLFLFGFNESFAGPHGLDKFRSDLTQLIKDTSGKTYDGKGPPRMALISPIAAEDLHDPNIDVGPKQNANLQLYTEAMRQVAAETGTPFVDLFTPTRKLFDESEAHLTINGVHLSDEGYQLLAPMLDQGLFGAAGAPKKLDEQLRKEVADKSFHWWHRYRAVNGYSIYGTRGEAGSDGTYRNRDVMERERSILDQMCANRDARIWRIAQGKPVPDVVDDSNTLPFIVPKTNVGGANDPNQKAGKLGSLDYIPAAEQKKHFTLPPGYEINLVASEEQFPELANPVAMNFDSRGRLWVTTMPSYPQWQPKTKLDDKLLILEDTNGDGQADECKVFAGRLHQPTGFELGAGGAFVAMQQDILFLKDTDGDDQADVRIRRLAGFDTADSHHGLAAFEWGPGGALYFQEGTFKQSQIETPYGAVRLSDAGTWRYEPRSEKFEVFASLAFANPWGHVFDRWGQDFIADASPGFNYWATPISGRVEFPDKHPGGSRAKHLDWGGSRSDREYPVFIKKRIRPTSGCEIVSSRHFPPEAQGNFLVNNVIGDLAVLQHTMREDGSGFTGDEIQPLVLCDHGNFRPVDLQFGPDGALYIVDWHNALIGHLQHNLREPNRDHSHGRIWRVTYKDRPLLTPPKIAAAAIPELLDLLKEPEDRTRYRARRELAERPAEEVIRELETWLAKLDKSSDDYQHQLLEGLWLYQTENVVNEQLLQRLLESPDHRARAAATRVLSYWRDRVSDPLAKLAKLVNDEHPRVRLEAVRACSFIESAKSMEVALEAINHDTDYFLEYTLDETIRALEESLGGVAGQVVHADHDHGAHGGDAHTTDAHNHGEAVGPHPLVFLEKSPKVVQFQLDRLSPTQLVMVERSPEDPRTRPVYEAILLREGVARQDREDALAALSTPKDTDAVSVLLASIDRLGGDSIDRQPVGRQLAAMLLRQDAEQLKRHQKEFYTAAVSSNRLSRAVAYAALVACGEADAAWEKSAQNETSRSDFLIGLALVPNAKLRTALRGKVVDSLDKSQPPAVRLAAIEALAAIPAEQRENFKLLTAFAAQPRFRDAAVRSMLRIPKAERSEDDARTVVTALVDNAEATPAARRTTDAFLDGMQLADELIAALPIDESRTFRERLRAVTVRVVRINTIQEEMRYDKPYFAVEAGRPVQIVLKNEDLMPHNLLITEPGKLRDVAMLAATMSPQLDAKGRQYVPDSELVLQAMKTVPSSGQAVLTFTAPKEPGEYPYVCTFPQHWTRMYGVMVVVPDLDAWQANPKPPADPLGNTREVVQNWKLEDFPVDLAALVEGRTVDIGQRLFKEANCINCHKLRGEGGNVGPELTEVFKKLKGDPRAVLREMLEPSRAIDPKYTLYNIATDDGKIISGIIVGQNARQITVITNPDNPQPQSIERDEIDRLAKSPVSMMPKGVLDRFTKDEIYEILGLIQSSAQAVDAKSGE